MTTFIKSEFYGSEYLSYQGKFVARFKYQRGSKASFITFLIKNFTVEEYFARLDNREAPLEILRSKGYLQPHIKKWLKEAGYPVTQEGYKQFIAAQVQTRLAKA